MSEPLDQARDAVAARIATRAEHADVEDLVKLADAYQKVKFGPQGYDARPGQTQETTTTERIGQPERRGAGCTGG